jgi:hypothetical protein
MTRVQWRVGAATSIVVLLGFVGTVAVATWNERPAASASLRFNELTTLSKYELRERAFQVAAKIGRLQSDYQKRSDEIFKVYDQQKAIWEASNKEYNKAITDYNDWHNTYRYSPFSVNGNTSTYLGTGNATLGTIGTQSPKTPEPSYPSSAPGPEPMPPVVTVDSDWQQRAQAVQEEAAAVWEEMCHRLGYYPPLFQPPGTYQPSSDLPRQALRLENQANNLH